jgi:hypothetical protein
MHLATTRDINGLLAGREPPCVSLYQPTDRGFPGNRENPVRFKNHLRDIETSLRRKYPAREIRPILEKFEQLAADESFWSHRADGLAVLAAADTFEVFDLPRKVLDRVVVADSFHVKPLLRIVQSADRYQLLCLTRHTAKLYEGNRDVLETVEPSRVPGTVEEALGEDWNESRQMVDAGDGSERRAALGDNARLQGSGDRKNQVDVAGERFFRAVDAAVLEHHSRPSGLPLILVAMAQHQTPFREITRNNFLMPDALAINPDTATIDDLRAKAWQLMEPHYRGRLSRLIDTFHASKNRKLATEDLKEAATAAATGRVGIMLIEADREMPGRIDSTTGALQIGKEPNELVDDLFDDLAEIALRNGAEVVVIPADRMPTQTGVAAVFRF